MSPGCSCNYGHGWYAKWVRTHLRNLSGSWYSFAALDGCRECGLTRFRVEGEVAYRRYWGKFCQAVALAGASAALSSALWSVPPKATEEDQVVLMAVAHHWLHEVGSSGSTFSVHPSVRTDYEIRRIADLQVCKFCSTTLWLGQVDYIGPKSAASVIFHGKSCALAYWARLES